MGIKILGTGTYLPETIAQNSDFEKFIDTSDEWILSRTGIRQRRIAMDEPAWYMGFLAAKQALENAKVTTNNIQLVLFTSCTPDFFTPSMSCMLAGELGLSGVMCIDINCACTGFVYALDMARRYLCTGDVQNVLIVSGEAISRITDYSDRNSCILFGDGAGACVVTASDGIFSSYLDADGTGAHYLYAGISWGKTPFHNGAPPTQHPRFDGPDKPGHIVMDGRAVYKFATRAMSDSLVKACQKQGITPRDLDLIIPHQANTRIIQASIKSVGVDMSRVYVNIERYGNTSSASAQICLDELSHARRLRNGMLIGIVGFGAGLTCGCVVFEW